MAGPRTRERPAQVRRGVDAIRFRASGASVGRSSRGGDDAWSGSDLGWAVADGIGSRPRAAESARFAVEEFQRRMRLRENLLDVASAINDACSSQFGSEGGTTLVAAVPQRTGLVVGHSGDSSALLVRNGAAHRLTRDHSVHEFALDHGVDTRSGVNLDGDALAAYVGMPAGFRFDVVSLALAPPDRVVLLTDGVSKVFSDAEIAELVRSIALGSAAQLLVERAVAHGAADDCTAIVIEAER